MPPLLESSGMPPRRCNSCSKCMVSSTSRDGWPGCGFSGLQIQIFVALHLCATTGRKAKMRICSWPKLQRKRIYRASKQRQARPRLNLSRQAEQSISLSFLASSHVSIMRKAPASIQQDIYGHLLKKKHVYLNIYTHISIPSFSALKSCHTSTPDHDLVSKPNRSVSELLQRRLETHSRRQTL